MSIFIEDFVEVALDHVGFQVTWILYFLQIEMIQSFFAWDMTCLRAFMVWRSNFLFSSGLLMVYFLSQCFCFKLLGGLYWYFGWTTMKFSRWSYILGLFWPVQIAFLLKKKHNITSFNSWKLQSLIWMFIHFVSMNYCASRLLIILFSGGVKRWTQIHFDFLCFHFFY